MALGQRKGVAVQAKTVALGDGAHNTATVPRLV
jgi:hypothetical protein